MRSTRTTPCAPAWRTRTVWGSVLIGLAVLSLPAAQAVAKNPKCSISGPGQITAGEPVTFTADWANFSGSKSPYTVSWTSDPDATLDPPRETGLQSDTADSDVTFATAGQKTVQIFVVDTPMGSTRGKGNPKPKTCAATLTVMVEEGQAGTQPIARGDTYATPVGNKLVIQVRDASGAPAGVAGILYNDFYTDPDRGEEVFGPPQTAGGKPGLTVDLPLPGGGTTAKGGAVTVDADGAFEYQPPAGLADNQNDSFTYRAKDPAGNLSAEATVNIHILSDQPDFKIMMNYELGMHCTGFEFSYCCILPPYNSIVAQVVKPQVPGAPTSNADFPRLLEGDPNNGLDGLGRETVLRDYKSDGSIQKYYLEYFHDAMPRLEGNVQWGLQQNSTLISDIELNSMLYWNTPYDSALVDTDGSITGVPGKLVRAADVGVSYNGYGEVVVGDGSYKTPTSTVGQGGTDNFANGWLNHFYIYENLEGTLNGTCVSANGTVTTNRCDSDAACGASESCDFSLERDKIRLGVAGHVEYPANVGAALQPMGPVSSTPVPFDNVLTFSGETGTVVYTQAKVLENLPIMLTSPRIWEALGLPLTPFEDTINFFNEPGAVDEDAIRPFVAMKAQLYEADCDQTNGGPDGNPDTADCAKGDAVTASNGHPVIGFGAAPIDIPNCERCHAAPAYQLDANGQPDPNKPNVNSPSYVREGDGQVYGPINQTLEAITDQEIAYWKSIYPSLNTGTDWYARLKGAAVNMLAIHDYDIGTGFLDCYPDPSAAGCDSQRVWPTALTANKLPEYKRFPQNTRMGHDSVICQKCHGDNVIAAVNPLGPKAGYFLPPISEAIHNAHRAESAGGVIAFGDELGRFGGCQGCHPAHRSDGVMDRYPITVGGDNANADGDNRLGKGGCFVGRDVHSNPLKDVDGAETPEHLNAVGQWLSDNVFRNQAGLAGSAADVRGIWCTNCHTQLSQEIWATENCPDLINGECDPDANPRAEPTLAAVAAAVGVSEAQAIAWLDPTSTNPLGDFTHAVWDPDYITPDAYVAIVEVTGSGCTAGYEPYQDLTYGADVCAQLDADGDPSYRILEGFCTTDDCLAAAQATLDAEGNNGTAFPVRFSDATDGRDHWLAAGEPHCADCHAAPYVEQSGNITPYPPFNYPRKASLSRYTRGHQDISCQGCHESIHGLYPVGPAIDNTSYAQAAALNADGSHGPLKCGACHAVADPTDPQALPTWLNTSGGNVYGITDYDSAVTWAHTYTAEADVRASTCQNCHGNFSAGIDAGSFRYLGHADDGRTSRLMMDKAETAQLGHVLGTTPAERAALCSTCHSQLLGAVSCSDGWRRHLTQGRVAESVWEEVSANALGTGGTLCGW